MYKVLWSFVQIYRSYKGTKFRLQRKWRHILQCTKYFTPGFLCIVLLVFLFLFYFIFFCMFYGVFDHFSRTCEVKKFWMIKLYLEVSDVIHANKHRKYANCVLHVNFRRFLLMRLSFMIKKGHFKLKFVLWPQVLFSFFMSTLVQLLIT